MTTDTLTTFLADTEARIGGSAASWAAAAPALVDELAARWELELGDPFDDTLDAFVVAATRGGARPVVLKLVYPDGWFIDEVAALSAWGGEGAVELIDHDPRGAQLLARAEPGTSLRDHDDEDEALTIAAGVLERLWVPDPGGLRTVGEETAEWIRTMPARHALAGRPFSRELLHEATAFVRDLVATPKPPVLLHGDLHLGNVVRSADGFVAVDPKPLVGEREFDAGALIRDGPEALAADRADGQRRVQHRFDLLSDRLDLDRARLQMWTFVTLVDYTLWDFESGRPAFGRLQLAVSEMARKIEV